MVKQKFVALLSTICLFVGLSNVGAAGGTSGGAFLKIIPSARPAGMGGAFTANANDINSLYFNPAGLAQAEKKEFGFTHNIWISGVNYEFVAGAMPLAGVGTVGAALSMVSLQIDETKEAAAGGIEITGKKLAVSDMAVVVGFGRKINDSLLIGANGKMVSESISTKSGSAFGFDAGAIYSISKDISLGACVQNLGTKMKLDTLEAGLPMTIKAGGVYRMMANTLNIAGDINYLVDAGKMSIRAGGEYLYSVGKDLAISARGGYQTTDVTGAGLTFGGGIVYKLGSMDAIIDLSYSQLGDLGSPIRISLNIRM